MEVFDVCTNGRNATDDFMAWHTGELCTRPLTTHLVQIGVADATESDVDLHVVCARHAAVDLQRLQGFVARVGTVGMYKHVKTPWAGGLECAFCRLAPSIGSPFHWITCLILWCGKLSVGSAQPNG